jgi:hypothetical protein
MRAIEFFMPHEIFGVIEDAFFVHCGLTLESETPTDTITGLPADVYPDGKLVHVLADGIFYEGKVFNGGLTLPFTASTIHVGLPYSTIIEPLNPNAGSSQGTARGKKQKINRVTLCFYESNRCKVGIDQNHLFDLNNYDGARVPEPPYFTAGLLTSEDMTVDLQGEWADEATISIVHDKPLPFTINAVVPHVSINEP